MAPARLLQCHPVDSPCPRPNQRPFRARRFHYMRDRRLSPNARQLAASRLFLLVGAAAVTAAFGGCTGDVTGETVGQESQALYSQPVVDRAKVQLNGTWKFTASNTLTGAEVTGYNDSGWLFGCGSSHLGQRREHVQRQ